MFFWFKQSFNFLKAIKNKKKVTFYFIFTYYIVSTFYLFDSRFFLFEELPLTFLSFQVALLAMDFFNFCLSENFFISPSVLKYISSGLEF